jgi:hypothetical protein
MNDEHDRVVIRGYGPDRPCTECGELLTSYAITDSYFEASRNGPQTMIGFGEAGGTHLHGVAVIGRDQLTVRAAVRRWWRGLPRDKRAAVALGVGTAVCLAARCGSQ